jgi:hypothetical protein
MCCGGRNHERVSFVGYGGKSQVVDGKKNVPYATTKSLHHYLKMFTYHIQHLQF